MHTQVMCNQTNCLLYASQSTQSLIVYAAIFLTLNNVCVLSSRDSFLCISFTAVECPALAPIPNGAITYGPDMTADFLMREQWLLIPVMMVSFWVSDLRLERV